ncbi:MAG: hypothetical protein H0W62_11780 [Chitinophagales bacterium]|nr:hypothetical protein [Chitinophagales bacterium]
MDFTDPEITNDSINLIESLSKQYTLVLLKRTVQKEEEVSYSLIQKEHLRHLLGLRAKGMLAIHGPVTEDDFLKEMYIFNTADKEIVRNILENDPAIKSGQLVYEIYSWYGIPGDHLVE